MKFEDTINDVQKSEVKYIDEQIDILIKSIDKVKATIAELESQCLDTSCHSLKLRVLISKKYKLMRRKDKILGTPNLTHVE